MKRSNKVLIIVLSVLFILVLSFGIMRYLILTKKEPDRRLSREIKRYVKVEPVNYQTIISPVEADGRLNSVSEVAIIAEASGKIQTNRIPLKTGSIFKKGDILFTIYTEEAELALKARVSSYMNSLANLLPDISIDFPEYESIIRDFFNAIDINKKLPSFPDIDNEKLKIFLASRNILSEYYSIKKDELQLIRHTVFAPFNGTYTEVFLEAGAYTNTGGRVASAIQTDQLELEVPLDRFDAGWVKIGDNVKIISDYNLELKGKVIRKNSFVDENTQSQSVFVKIDPAYNKNILAGEYLTAVFPGHPIDSAMEIPRNIVFNTNEVFVIKNSRLQKKNIDMVKINERTLIFRGLPKGDSLVSQPMINVLEGTLVDVAGNISPDKKLQSKSKQVIKRENKKKKN